MVTSNLSDMFLENLAKSSSGNDIFIEEANSIKSAISSSTTHEAVKKQLKALNNFCYRVPEISFEIIHLVFEIAKSKKLKYEYKFTRRYNADIRIETFSMLESLIYNEPETALTFLWQGLNCGVPEVSDKAKISIKKISEHEMDAFKHIGLKVECSICNFLKTLPEEEVVKHQDIIMSVCSNLLSLEVRGSYLSGPYDITIETGGLPESGELATLRIGISDLLTSLYKSGNTLLKKRRILSVLHSITRHPFRGKGAPEAILALINADVARLLAFYEDIIPNAPAEELQKIGHNLYWMHYHHSSEYNEDNIKRIIALKDSLYSDKEQNIFNVLIGFEAVYSFEWESRLSSEEEVKRENSYREEKVVEYIKSINDLNKDSWRKRILEYVKIESNDLATFIYFGKFLKQVGANCPEFAKELLNQFSEELGQFRAGIIDGLVEADITYVKSLLDEWLNEGRYLESICHVLAQTSDLSLDYYERTFEVAKKEGDQIALNMLLGAVAERYSDTKNTAPLLTAIIKELTSLNDTRWVNVYWWRKKADSIAEKLGEEEVHIILNSLLDSQSIDTHEEWILSPIARKYPTHVLEFFKERILKESTNEDSDYEAIPYRFYDKLSGVLNDNIVGVISAVIAWMGLENDIFRRRGPDFIHAITDYGFDEVANLLAKLYQEEKATKDNLFDFLNEYAGTLETEIIWKAIIEKNPEDAELKERCIGHFFCTGETSGFDGVSIAYKNRSEMFKQWQKDGNPAIRLIGEEGAKVFKDAVKREEQRTEEQKIVRENSFKAQNPS